MPTDILQILENGPTDGDILLNGGDIVLGESTQQHQRDILIGRKGDYRLDNSKGVAFEDYEDDDNPEEMLREISKQYAADGMNVKNISITDVDATYK